MLEVPVTIGYVGGSFARCHQLQKRLSRPPFQKLHLAGVLAKLGLVRSVWLSPERETTGRLIRLLRQSMREGCGIVNLFFHTSSLQVGCTPFVRTQEERNQLLRSLATLLEFCRESGVKSIPLSQAAQGMLRSGPGMY
jgi:aryl-alcohol dehydrogenase-like predicted oxidoreductase